MSTDDQLRRQAALQEALLKRTAEGSLRAFVEQAFPILEPHTPFVPNDHIDLLCEYLEAVTAGALTRVLINMPPRSMKSILVSVLWPVWEWVRRPGGRWIFASYADALASRHSLDRRRVIQSDLYQRRWGARVQLAADQNVKHEFQNTERGVMVATSIGGSITGKGGNRIVVDDPHNPSQVLSEVQRQTALDFFDHTLATRLDDKKRDAIVVVAQRLHDKDVSARCLELGYHHVCLPAEAEVPIRLEMPRSGRVFVRDTGQLLWEAREGRAELEALKCQLGSTGYAGQYQQRPIPPGGVIFHRASWRFYDELPVLSRVAQSWDMAFKDTRDSDFVVGLVAGRQGANIFLIDLVKGRWGFSDTRDQVMALRQRYPQARQVYVEEAANGHAILDALKDKIGGLIGVKPKGGKLARAQAAQPLVESGNVYLPNPRGPNGQIIRGLEWVEPFRDELTLFPNGAHDDQVDAFTQLVAQWWEPELIPRIRCVEDPSGIPSYAQPWRPGME